MKPNYHIHIGDRFTRGSDELLCVWINETEVHAHLVFTKIRRGDGAWLGTESTIKLTKNLFDGECGWSWRTNQLQDWTLHTENDSCEHNHEHKFLEDYCDLCGVDKKDVL